LVALGAAVLLISGLGLAIAVWSLGRPNRTNSNFSLVTLPVVQRPATVPAGAVKLPDNATVIGVENGDQARAYLLEALYYPAVRHVINDVVGGKPITITYCDMMDRVAVFTDPDAKEPLQIATGGWTGKSVAGRFEGSMLLRVGSTWYRQDTTQSLVEKGSAPFPYREADFVRTTWKQWRYEHAGTDVYIGESHSTAPTPDVDDPACEPMK
jgi:hypothetical protein